MIIYASYCLYIITHEVTMWVLMAITKSLLLIEVIFFITNANFNIYLYKLGEVHMTASTCLSPYRLHPMFESNVHR